MSELARLGINFAVLYTLIFLVFLYVDRLRTKVEGFERQVKNAKAK